MKSFTLSLFFLLFFLQLNAQLTDFPEAVVTLPQLSYSSCAWGDFDNDGDLDIALSGIEGNDPVTKIYRNENGNYTDLQAGLFPLHYGSVEWGDYDNDHDLDLLLTGMDLSGNTSTLIYQNNNGLFTNSGISLPGISDGTATWGDFDNDGDLDILILGDLLSGIYRNDGNNQFVKINTPFPLMQSPMGCWVDYNNDGQLDAMVCGNTGDGVISKLYKNNQGVFTEVILSPGPFIGLHGGQVRWADLDNDGDQDLVIAGMDVSIEGYFIQYRNDGNDHFTKFADHTSNLLSTSVDLGDFDADGLLDIILMGRCVGCGGTSVTELYRNLGSFTFEEIYTTLPGFKQGGVSWGDFNNDGFTDLLFTGTDLIEAPKTGIFYNPMGDITFFTANTPPSTPGGLTVSVVNEKLMLQWNKSQDTETPQDALSYNICIGTLPTVHDILSPMADLGNGFRSVVTLGNSSADTSWMVTGIPTGVYYFSVQAIDNGFMSGAFSQPQMFAYAPVGLSEPGNANPLKVFPSPFTDFIQISGNHSGNTSIRVVNANGKTVYEGPCDTQINTANWSTGLYIFKIISDGDILTIKALKK